MTHCGSEALTKYKRMFGSGRMAQCGSSHIGEVEGEIHQDRVIACSISVMIKNGGTGNVMKNTILCAAKVCAQVIFSHVIKWSKFDFLPVVKK